MELDIRFPIGFMFGILGLILTVFGLATQGDPEMYRQSFSVNINFWTGLVMLLTGLIMLWSGYRSLRNQKRQG